MSILNVNKLSIGFDSDDGPLPIVQDLSFTINQGEIVGLVGESGCGKSVTAMSIMGLLPTPPGRILGGEILFEGEDLVQLPEHRKRVLRGNRLSMVFQEPMTSLNPTLTIGYQLVEAMRLHREVDKAAATEHAVQTLELVGVSAARRRLSQYAHELSGGLRQRVMIAMALMCHPGLLIADEPTTALDVTIQAQILDLLSRLRAEMDMGILLITHDLGVVAEFCDRVLVMYAGRVVESAPVEALFDKQYHPYTHGLLASIPRLEAGRKRLATIAGMVPLPGDRPAGCAFFDRCGRVQDQCQNIMPDRLGTGDHDFACWNPVP